MIRMEKSPEINTHTIEWWSRANKRAAVALVCIKMGLHFDETIECVHAHYERRRGLRDPIASIQTWASERSTMAEHIAADDDLSVWCDQAKSLITFLFTTAFLLVFSPLISHSDKLQSTMQCCGVWNIISVKCCVLYTRSRTHTDAHTGICSVRIKIGWHRRKGEFTVYALEVTSNVVCHQRSAEHKRYGRRNKRAGISICLFKACSRFE